MRKLSITVFIATLLLFALAAPTLAQRPFNTAEFAARRAKLFEKITDGLAIVFAAKGQHYPVKFRQAPDFYYLTGIEEPGAVLVMLGPTKASFLFAPPRSQPQIRADGPGIWQLDKREEIYGLTRTAYRRVFLDAPVLGPAR
jgi:hypothetical protein